MNVGEMQRKLSTWAEQDKGHRFFDLHHLLYDEDWLLLAHDYVAQNAGSVTAGCDGVDMSYFDENLAGNLRKLAADLRSGAFEANPVRRVYIPKANGKLRPLGIPSIRDRIVQEALRMILEPIYEADFVQTSYGFRPGRCTRDAVSRILWAARGARKCYWIMEGDISSYFDTIHHRKLMQLLRRRIADRRVLDLIWQFLRAGVVERNVLRATNEGTPQGGIISPLLANVYLHELDKYMEKYTALPGNEKRRRRRHGEANFVHVRYADDFVVLCNGTRAQAVALKAELTEFLQGELHLTLSPEKTAITHFNDGFKFLGFRFKRCLGGKGTMVAKCLIPKGAVLKHLVKLQAATAPSTCTDSVVTKLRALQRLIGGWCRYYQCCGNVGSAFAWLENKTHWLIGHWLGRKFKGKIRQMKRTHWRDGGFAAGNTRLRLHSEYKTIRLMVGAYSKPNPYTTQAVLAREELLPDSPWLGFEDRPGQADLKLIVLARDGHLCQDCKAPVTEGTSHLHHLRDVRFFKRPVDANYPDNCVVLCVPCHKVRTEMRRQQLESRMR